ncbi:hypothetical protein CKQ80_01080 [Pseudomonas moraviensis]|uniref:Uncharacterized protein n=1 Tax=Pseudomonas moraviensis TaxID=321662 RepID=A0A2A2PE97_9PSED|nr:hypothetical protein [Pseudomonas moraviensis]PAW49423.1 hypothetical protein CKQ68_18905 [Pseudomonas moraviensis]PAW53929.1 hypothetical protein CKQ80_01080 [Pseudomonas moraviensis]
MRKYKIQYLFNGEPRTQEIELNQSELPIHDAAMHLLELHFGDGENSLIMPTADSTVDEILDQAALVGITEIEVHVLEED